MPENEINFALVGAAGYVAPRHMRAIKDVEGRLLAAFDPSDSVGVIDSYFPDARFFVEFERFDRHIEKLRRAGTQIDYVSICSPNYLHDSHVRFALRSGAHAICEKPLVLNPWNVDGLAEVEASSDRRVNTILQLRLHPSIQSLKKQIDSDTSNKLHEVDLTYITSRGRWYHTSWKGEENKSGGIATNIGVHFYDMLSYLFGEVQQNYVHLRTTERASGYLEYAKARVRWFLSIDRNDLPNELPAEQTTFRSITIDGKEIEFSSGFTDLHTRSYEQILEGNGFSLSDARSSIETVAHIRTADLSPRKGEQHPFCRKHNNG